MVTSRHESPPGADADQESRGAVDASGATRLENLALLRFLILVALLIRWKLHYLLLLIAAFAGFIHLWLWLSRRFPRTMTVINIILLGMLRGGRRRW